MSKKRDKSDKSYKCQLCGNIEKYLFAFCACRNCEEQIRKCFVNYKAEREKLEAGATAKEACAQLCG